ncbi:MAG: T3SS (YopN, CesT) and YbjN peptide-binding chaperone 1 [Thainema sp.]
MKFETAAQQVCYEQIVPWMNELFGETLLILDDEPVFINNFGSAVASTKIIPWGDEESLIVTRAYVVTNIDITPDLTYYLLRENDGIYFGRFALDSENDIVFEHSLVGSTCDKKELQNSVMSVIEFADAYDDEIVVRWGGQRALDRWTAMSDRGS